MPDNKYYVIGGSSLDYGTTFRRLVVRAVIPDLTVTQAASDPEVMWNAINAVAADGYLLGQPPPGTSHTSVLLQRVFVRGYTTDGCEVDLVFESAVFGGPPTAYVRTDRSYVQGLTANTFRAASGRKPIAVGGATSGGVLQHYNSGQLHIPVDYVMCSYDRPMQACNVQGLSYGQPTWNIGQAGVAGTVNNATWLGLPKGFWKIIEAETSVARYSGYYTYSLTALTKGTEHWMEYGVLRNKETGEYVNEAANISLYDDYNVYSYINDIRNSPGVCQFGPYALENFAAIFGFVV